MLKLLIAFLFIAGTAAAQAPERDEIIGTYKITKSIVAHDTSKYKMWFWEGYTIYDGYAVSNFYDGISDGWTYNAGVLIIKPHSERETIFFARKEGDKIILSTRNADDGSIMELTKQTTEE